MEEMQQPQEEQAPPPSDGEIDEAVEEVSYSWPVISFDVPPYKSYHFHRQFRDSSNPNNFLKGVKWFHFSLFIGLLFSVYAEMVGFMMSFNGCAGLLMALVS